MGEQGQTAGTVLDVEQIKKLLPHRWPFLFVERLTDIVPYESCTGYKAVSYNEPHFAGHFPEFAVMPGVLIVEALAQTAGALIVHSMALEKVPQVAFMAIEKAKFRRPVVPGDLLRFTVRQLQHRGPVWKFEGKAFVGENIVAEGEFSAMIRTDA
ncbi:MAG: 3-hydroxyacyl-ACP dehydratase FabZ [Alphaproteobacteria bacterium]|nr:3-hydroxyacyl-ACP dehydratase FabZ [Alphaproteobacteria bacterium]MBL6939184.1 3-hydroxyacyl-ACP dehydratase FabZ [Alphaproteobacteria bacterium]MBL7096700.1 3-hydroxyacyl-ACP dehydratase FabZ [Alphaproteobacteria bacterium]